jgi:hypothetical protein
MCRTGPHPAGRGLAHAGEPPHPDPVRRQQMIQGAVDRFEKGAAVGAVLFGREPHHGLVKPAVGPLIVVTEHPAVSCESDGHIGFRGQLKISRLLRRTGKHPVPKP